MQRGHLFVDGSGVDLVQTVKENDTFEDMRRKLLSDGV